MSSSSDAARELVRLLPAVAVNLRLTALFDVATAELTPNQMLALHLVSTAPGGRMKAGEVAERLGISSPAATALVDRLVASGVVERSHGDDRRVVWISATGDGGRLLAELTDGLAHQIEAAIEDGYDAPTLDALVEGMRRVASFTGRLAEPPGRSHHERTDHAAPTAGSAADTTRPSPER
jgi:MarR family transcriptional regulator, transcriptional regulator for hemolysin